MRLPREDALAILRGFMNFYEHFGNDVPKEIESGSLNELLEWIQQVSPNAPTGFEHGVPTAPASERLNKALWIMDSGSGLDLVPWEDVRDLPPEQWHQLIRPILLDTAGGESKANQVVQFVLDKLGENVEALVLPSTPYVLSLGRRCQELGYGFWWEPYGLPHLMLPDG